MENSIAKKHPELVAEWSDKNLPQTPDEVSYGSNVLYWWKGKCGHEWQASPKGRHDGNGCPYCAGNKVLAGFNDLATRFPEVAKDWNYEKNYPLRPDQVTAFTNRKVWWIDALGHEWQARIADRSEGHGCPYCNDNKLLVGFNDLATTHPDIAAEWSERNLPLTPHMLSAKSDRNVWWKCSVCGHEWKGVVKARTTKGRICPVCADYVVKPGINDLATTDPDIAAEWDYEKNEKLPSEISRHSSDRAWWICPYGHSWNSIIYQRTLDDMECKECEKEFQTVILRLAAKYYAHMNQLSVVVDSSDLIGCSLETYFPDLRLVMEMDVKGPYQKKEQSVKAFLCESRGVKYCTIGRTKDTKGLLFKIRKCFESAGFYPLSNVAEDGMIIKEMFNTARKSMQK